MKIKVMIADDQRLMREGLKTILELERDIAVIGLAENGKDAVEKIACETPDVLLMDIRMPVMDGVECTGIVKKRYPGVKVLILTTFDDDEFIIDALKNGAVGYLLKDLPSKKLIGAIRDVYAGNSIMQPEIAAKVISRITGAAPDGAPPDGAAPDGVAPDGAAPKSPISSGSLPASGRYPLSGLTDREKEVLQLVGKGLTNGEIARHLFISEGTVKNYISNLYGKLQVSDRSKLTLYAIGNL